MRIVLVLLCLCLSACPKIPKLPSELDTFRTANEAERIAIADALQASQASLSSGRAVHTIVVENAFSSNKAKQVLVFEHPEARMRLELFVSNLHHLLSLLIVSEGQVHVVLPDEKAVYQGPASAALMARFFRIPCEPFELVHWLFGRLSATDVFREPINVSFNHDRSRVFLEWQRKEGGVVRALLVGKYDTSGQVHPVLEHFEIEVEQERIFVSEFSYPEILDSTEVPIPNTVNFWLPEQSLDGSVEVDSVSILPDLGPQKDRLFRKRIPRGADVFELGN